MTAPHTARILRVSSLTPAQYALVRALQAAREAAERAKEPPASGRPARRAA